MKGPLSPTWWKRERIVVSGDEMFITWHDRVDGWWFGTRLGKFWYYKVHRFPPPPPFDQNPVARHFGFVDGVPPCSGPVCQAHEWTVHADKEGEM